MISGFETNLNGYQAHVDADAKKDIAIESITENLTADDLDMNDIIDVFADLSDETYNAIFKQIVNSALKGKATFELNKESQSELTKAIEGLILCRAENIYANQDDF